MREPTKSRSRSSEKTAAAGLLFALSVALVPAAPASPPRGAPPPPTRAAAIDFNREVLPILSENCFACHGMDRNKRQAGLRLDTPEALKALPSGHIAVVPGKLKASALY